MKKKFIITVPIVIIVLGLLAVGGSFLYQKIQDARQRKLSLDALATQEYQGAFFSMYDISTFSAEDFVTYAGVPTYKAEYQFTTAGQINEAVEAALSSGNQITNIYIGLDPLMLWRSEKEDISKVQKVFETGLLTYIDAHPEISFQILFPFQSMEYWMDLEEGERQAFFVLLQQVTDILGVRNNMKVYYAGGQEWLINNPANYLSDFVTNEFVSQKIFLLTFCDNELQITSINAPEMIQQISVQIEANQENPPEFPDLSGWDIVLMGDSIIGNYEGSISIPGVVNGLSGASAYNCARGGASAAKPYTCFNYFAEMAEDFVHGTIRPDTTAGPEIQKYISDDHSEKRLCFIINYGVNDYFGGHPVENPEDEYDISTYAGGMRTGISILKEAYPDALYIIMGPGKVTYFEDGTELQSDVGGKLEDYYEISADISEEWNIPYIDLYQNFPPEGKELTDVLADGCHYNEYGRYLIGKKIVEFLADYE